MWTHEDLLDKKCTHREYYSQFVNQHVKDIVSNKIGINQIKNSTDEFFNDISLKEWDNFHPINNKGITLSQSVCIAKEAAQQIREENTNVDT